MSETCQKLAFTHPIVVLKSGLKNNWMKKLDRVNRPSEALIIHVTNREARTMLAIDPFGKRQKLVHNGRFQNFEVLLFKIL